MTVLLKVWKDKTLIGQCDAKCYDSKSEKCRCVCYGLHHGIGRNRSVDFLRTMKLGWRATYPERLGYKISMF